MRIKTKSFTLLEIIIVIALILSLFGISLPVYQSLLFGTEVESANKIAVSTLRTAQAQSISGLYDSQYGVKFTTTSIILFKGATYLTRDTTADVNYTLPATMTLSGQTEIVFTKLYGKPTPTGTITYSLNGKSATITINANTVKSY